MDNDQFLDAYLNTLETSEGAGGGDTVTGMATREYGVKNLLGVKEEDYVDNPKGLAKAVAQKNIDELIDMGIDWNNLPLSMKFNSLDIQYNMGSLKSKAPKYFAALKSGQYATAIKESLDAIGAYDPKRKGERPTKGIALRRAMFYNVAATELNLPTIISVDAINQDNPQKSAKVTYNRSEGAAIPVTYEFQSLHSTTKPGTIAVDGMTVEPKTEVEEGFKETDVVEPGTTDMLEEVEQEQFQRSVDAADRDEQKQQMESLLVDKPSIQTTDVAPETTDAIPVIDVPADEPEQPGLFDRFMGMFSSEDREAEKEQVRQDLLKELEVETIRPPAMNEGGLASGEIDYSVVDDEYELPTELDIARAKARQQMKDMGLDAPSILSPRTETRTAEEIASDRKTLAEMTPVIGDAMLAKEVADYIGEGSYGSATIGTAALGIGMIPGAGDILNKPLRAAAKKLRKKDADVANNMLKDTDSLETWKKQNPNPKPQKQNPDIEKAANDLLEGKITGKQYRSVVKENMPIVKINEVPEVPSFTEIVGALDKDKSAKGIIGLNKTVKDGTRVASRLDIPAYERFDKWVVSLHDAFDKKGRESLSGDILGYGKTAVLKNVEFKGSPTGAASISARKTNKSTIARIFGDYINAEPENVEEYARQVIKDKSWTQVGYNPFRHGFFYDKDTSMPIKSAEEVIQVGPLVLAKNAQKIKISEAKQVGPKGGLKIRTGKPIKGLKNLKETKTVFNEGGTVMDRQMSMFEDGGLMDEGGTTDPVSGNDVPPGSTQEEVRDDIPAQLSEGEFVFPADVVRFIGLEKLMNLRQEAKAGLARMEAMGQMGNSEEATIPDDIPFTLDDLDMEDDPMEFQVGGLVPNQFGVMEQPSQFAPTYQAPVMPVAQPMQQQQPLQTGFTPLTTPAVPTGGAIVPTFEQLLPTTTGRYDELKEYINNETGQTMTIPFVDGQPIYPIPEGFVEVQTDVVDAIEPEETIVPTARPEAVRDDPGGDFDKGPQYATTDVTGIGYDRSKLTPVLRETISEYGAGFGTLAETFGKAGVGGVISQLVGKDPKVAANSLTSSAFGGVLDSFRDPNGEVTYSNPDRLGMKTGKYSMVTPLHELSASVQIDISTVSRRVFNELEDVFLDDKQKPKTTEEVTRSMKTLADSLGVPTGVPGTNLTKSLNTLMREVSKAKATQVQEQLAAEKAEAERQRAAQQAANTAAAIIAAQQNKGDPKSDDDKGPGGTGYGSGSQGISHAGGGAGGRFGPSGGFSKGGLANKKPKPKKMKRGGLASKK